MEKARQQVTGCSARSRVCDMACGKLPGFEPERFELGRECTFLNSGAGISISASTANDEGTY